LYRENAEFHHAAVIQYYVKGKGKAVPLEAWSGPEGSRKLRFPDYMTTAHNITYSVIFLTSADSHYGGPTA
jgi:hypothetical protein